ncbi:MAG: DegT/DnrJ/EryC1/StrS family aminotransferase, partial [Nisaea sp.]
AHGATSNETPLGTFGDVACFSTMYRKAHMTGGCGGVVYSRNRDLYHKALAYADRGKPRWLDDFDDRDPRGYLFPALNLHNDEISCAIGISSLRRLDQTISNRLDFVFRLTALLKERSRMCRVFEFSNADSPFFIPVQFDQSSATCTKTEFAEAVRAEGIDLNPHYQYLAADWPWLQPYAMGDLDCRNARAVLDTSFNIFVNENYSEKDALSVAEAIEKVERHYKR